ncbi:MAG: DUF58 domain-containing protein [Methylophilaceae bacterium]|nr:DUF58 domain-containing protein [Methylophilaceae bacterium]
MNSTFIPQEFHYRLHWRARTARPGGHPTRTAGGAADFRGYVPFMQNPNPRHIDLRASLRSVPHQLMVRSYHERGAIAVVAIVDLSASMHFAGASEKRELAADIAASIAWSATRGGDAFGLIACDDSLRGDLFEPLSSRRGVAAEVRDKLMQSTPLAKGANALPLAASQLRAKRSLVFLISDFHLEESLITQTITSLAAHDVVPLVLWDSAEYEDLPKWGWARVSDMETGGERSLFLRPRLTEQIKSAYAERRARIVTLCKQAGARTPFFIQDKFNAELLTRHLLEAH